MNNTDKERIEREAEIELAKYNTIAQPTWMAHPNECDAADIAQGTGFCHGFRMGFMTHATKYAKADAEIKELKDDVEQWEVAHDNCASHFDQLEDHYSALLKVAEEMREDVTTLTNNGFITEMYPDTVKRIEKALSSFEALKKTLTAKP